MLCTIPKSVNLLLIDMPLQPKKFRFNAKNFFLTYLRCSLTKEIALQQLLAASLPNNRKFICVARELHDDGCPHLHVLIQLEGGAQLTNPRLFDLRSSVASTSFHPNIQCAKSSSDVKAYIEKGGDYIDWGEFQVDSRSSRNRRHDLSSFYANSLNSETPDRALEIIREKDPRAFVLQYHNLKSNVKRIFARPLDPYISYWAYSMFTITSRMQAWLEHNL